MNKANSVANSSEILIVTRSMQQASHAYDLFWILSYNVGKDKPVVGKHRQQGLLSEGQSRGHDRLPWPVFDPLGLKSRITALTTSS